MQAISIVKDRANVNIYKLNTGQADTRGVDRVAPVINVNEQPESNPDCIFHSSVAYFASGRSYHQNLLNYNF